MTRLPDPHDRSPAHSAGKSDSTGGAAGERPDQPTSADIAETVDYIAIRRLQHRYADAITRRAWSELDTVLHPECTLGLDLGDRTLDVAGAPEIARFIAGAVERFSFFEFAVLSTVVELDDPGPAPTEDRPQTARCRLWMVELRQGIDDGRRTNAFGVYQDRLERGPTGWRFTARRYGSVSRTAERDAEQDQVVFKPTIWPLADL